MAERPAERYGNEHGLSSVMLCSRPAAELDTRENPVGNKPTLSFPLRKCDGLLFLSFLAMFEPVPPDDLDLYP
jgi:hypothetical protein